jgi:hypothetical protein
MRVVDQWGIGVNGGMGTISRSTLHTPFVPLKFGLKTQHAYWIIGGKSVELKSVCVFFIFSYYVRLCQSLFLVTNTFKHIYMACCDLQSWPNPYLPLISNSPTSMTLYNLSGFNNDYYQDIGGFLATFSDWFLWQKLGSEKPV